MNYLNGLRAVAMVAIAVLTFSSCSEDQTSFSIDDIQGKATLVGSLTYDDNQAIASGTGTSSVKPAANTLVYVKVSNVSLSPNYNGAGNTVYEVTTDANGEFKVEVPAVEPGSVVTIQPATFTGKYYAVVAGATGTSTVVKDGVYSVGGYTVSVLPNDIKVVGKRAYRFTDYDGINY
ncbi:MAG: hypothetical protein LUE99_14065 [Bacteroides sp.]|nr:hypothetical protein [Bacteroides sp.]